MITYSQPWERDYNGVPLSEGSPFGHGSGYTEGCAAWSVAIMPRSIYGCAAGQLRMYDSECSIMFHDVLWLAQPPCSIYTVGE